MPGSAKVGCRQYQRGHIQAQRQPPPRYRVRLRTDIAKLRILLGFPPSWLYLATYRRGQNYLANPDSDAGALAGRADQS